MSNPSDRHVYPLTEAPDIHHDPAEGPFFTGNYEAECWACQNGVCVQRISYVNEVNGAKVVVHGVLRQ
jgi:hypothetical protein